ncbi:serine hydrolase domain-containing protein [Sphingopyxis alaskensis]|jgi:CubicO group peptidase (beta-lactamase class C family)|uniref:Beta-lactamase n=1 Tax=Sphingopyxis alaskensis (strain DSM 13593 / LMG 18877 / RB2256) TaxID=317655 RepID=Q1GSW5_SPHAL|nr:serine hydrolase [Sphingopyxis alaskensis]ABF53257.1 beta-lactamase [Sphingopyxis alaskensis RB2256]MCM3418676.1 beta-lactamase family protein [Sphingopyxis alaskensis]
MRRFLAAVLFGAAAACSVPATTQTTDQLPKDLNVLFWTQDQRDRAFRTMETVPRVVVNPIEAGDTAYPLPQGTPIDFGLDVDAHMAKQRNAGLIIVQDGKIRLEKYALGHDAAGRWTSFSVAKSFTSTLVGAAVKDGYIKSLDDKVAAYIPGLKGSAYDDVSVRQLLTMTSGVKWNEDYTDPKSDVAQFNLQKPVAGEDITVSYMKGLPREAPAGSKWVYKTGETNLIGVLVSSATGKTLSQYLSEKIWKPFGMEQDAAWMLGPTGHEISGCCMSASLRDYARFGQFILNGGVAGSVNVLPDDWLASATTKQAEIGVPGRGYGYQWWTNDDGSFAAQGIFGQGIFIDPKRKLVIASNGNWPTATDPEGVGAAREAFYKAVQAAVDREAK